jgi:hypothetical protein
MFRFSVVSMATLTGLAAGASFALAVENFVPYGHTYGPGSGPLPYLNSPQDKINAQADIYQTEIWKKQMERKLFDSNMQRFINHDLSPGSHDRPTY